MTAGTLVSVTAPTGAEARGIVTHVEPDGPDTVTVYVLYWRADLGEVRSGRMRGMRALAGGSNG